MTVGEKIQFYRKQCGLSQEELGQKLLVSRQTVSLWEMDKTLPTVDNLLRLKEIFSISIDDILSTEEPRTNDAVTAESYTVQYTGAELREVFKHTILPLVKRLALFSAICIYLFISGVTTDAPDLIIGLGVGVCLLGTLSYIKGIWNYKSTWKSGEKRLLESTYYYDVYDEHLTIRIVQGEELKITLKVCFEEIERVQSFRNYLLLQFGGRLYILKKDQLKEASRLHTLLAKPSSKGGAELLKNKFRTVSVLLLILSIASILGALICVGILTEINQVMTENMWVFFLFTPFPIASIAFGVYLRKKGYKTKKNIIVGVVMAALLCVYGSFTFLFSGVYSHDEKPILRVEKMMEIDIPAHTRINTEDWTNGTQTGGRGYILATSDIFFEASAVKDFEKALPKDGKWISSVPSELIGITSHFCDGQAYDYCIIYNTKTGEFNTLPREGGTYTFINILYDTERNVMRIVEYKIEYKK